MSDYQSFLASKAPIAHASGFEPSQLPDHLFDFQKSCVEFAIRQGRTGFARNIFAKMARSHSADSI